MEKRYIIIYVTDEYSRKADKTNSYIYEYENHNLELKNVGSKQMLLVSKKDGENELLIDMDAVEAIDYSMMLVL